MARASAMLVDLLRRSAARLECDSTVYKWSHFAHCNCGQLVQTITGLGSAEIYKAAYANPGDWAEQAAAFEWPDYGDRPALDEGAWEPLALDVCTATGVSIAHIFEGLHAVGLDSEDIQHLERLSDARVRRRLGTSTTEFHYADRRNVIAYLRAWADLLAEELCEREAKYLSVPLAAE